MYTCGVAVGLFFYGVAEPVWHYKATGSGAWALRSADMNDGDRANYALMQAYFHWGIHGWVPYILLAFQPLLMDTTLADIAVLCRNNKEADLIQSKFSQHQIPSVLLATRSIFKTLEAASGRDP